MKKWGGVIGDDEHARNEREKELKPLCRRLKIAIGVKFTIIRFFIVEAWEMP